MGKDQELLDAARNGNLAVVEKLLVSKAKRSGPLASLRRGPGANVQDSSGYSALHHAALNGHKEIVELLLTNEASTNLADEKGSSPLHLAAWSGNVDIVRLLLSHGPSIPNVNLLTKDNETALHCAAQYGHTKVVCLLLEYSCDPTIRNSKQETALDLAAQYGRLDTVGMLVRTHPELIQPYNGSSSLNLVFPHTPLHLASRNGHKAVVEVLLAGGMNVNVRTGSGSALHEAALCGKTEVVRTLLQNGIELDIRDSQNNTVIDLLKQFPCRVDIYSLIKECHRSVYNDRDDFFSTSMSNSPFENPNYSVDSASPVSVSPLHYDSYERRLSSSCSISAASDTQHNRYAGYNASGFSKSFLDGNYLHDEMLSRSQDFDSVSVCSTASSCCSRDRRSPYNAHGQLPSPGSVSNKISPTPPKKPPRRNLSTSPTHATPHMSLSSDQNGYDTYEYAFIKINNSQDQLDRNDTQEYSNLKRKSRDIETETEEELLLLVFPGTTYDATSNGSLSSSVSLSDKSVSTDNNTVEEYVGDAPFAGLFKGSVTPTSDIVPPSQYAVKVERPTSLKQLKNVREPTTTTTTNGFRGEHCSKNDAVGGVKSSSPSGGSRHVGSNGGGGAGGATTNGDDKTASMSILSPFDEQEEWAKISEIMASFGSGSGGAGHNSIVTELEREFESRLGFNRVETNNNATSATTTTFTSVRQWLQSLGLADFEKAFVNFGYDDVGFISGVINDCDLKEIGLMNENDRETLLKRSVTLPNRIGEFWAAFKAKQNGYANVTNQDLVKKWLESINLGVYADTFRRMMYNDMERIKRIWEVELTAFLEINKPGHRRRILASVNEGKSQCPAPPPHIANDASSSVAIDLNDLNADLRQLRSNIRELEEEIHTKSSPPATAASTQTESGTLRYRKKSRPAPPPPPPTATRIEQDLEIRNPSELLVGVPATLKAQWRHKPSVLVTGTVDYVASYLGSTVVKELRGTESTKKSIQKLKKSTSVVDCRVTPEIILAISYRGVKFLNVTDRSSICEHEIRNIHCACQDSEDLTHFAYITKDRASKTHYCHVFCVQTMDQATEVILTLGEAFEVAYQMALKEHGGGGGGGITNACNGHTRSHSANAITYVTQPKKKSPKRDGPRFDLAGYFVRGKDGRLPLAALIADGKFDDVKRLLGMDETTKDAKMLKRVALNVANGAFRERYRVEKDAADELFALAVDALSYRSVRTAQLSKYYRSSYVETSANGAAESPDAAAHERLSLGGYLARDKHGRVLLWTMLVEERFDELRAALRMESQTDEEVLRRIALDVASKTFRDANRVERKTADEIFECAVDELTAKEGSTTTTTQLSEYYNDSYN